MILRSPGCTMLKNTVILFAIIFIVVTSIYLIKDGRADVELFAMAMIAPCICFCIIELLFLSIYWHLFLINPKKQTVKIVKMILCVPIKKSEVPLDRMGFEISSEYLFSRHGSGTVWALYIWADGRNYKVASSPFKFLMERKHRAMKRKLAVSQTVAQTTYEV